VVDLDPGPGCGVVDCARLAVVVRDLLAADGMTAWVKTSGSKGLHVSVPLVPTAAEAVIGYAKSLAERLQAMVPDLAVARMAKDARGGRVFVDWSQNSGKKTTAAPYTLRAKARPTVSAPVAWDEVERFEERGLEFAAPEVLDRLERDGDLWAGLADPGSRCRLPA
jgi:bifunctional non-homologous end joining protein LigD